ncbi:hypothetical protein DUZ99_08365 [Xylanibacillus composti]|nr:hypothetical protein [Xylanibacillus composti]MDT9725007.1 hypothetical protein [Xylanibacillus composti]
MKRTRVAALQIAFTYMGTVVGAGFATGQEILQFFTRYGTAAAVTIAVASFLFVKLGTKLMLLAHDRRTASFEQLNGYLFGERAGLLISWFLMIVLFGVTSVMLAGAGSVFMEHFGLPYQAGLVFTLLLTLLILRRGMNAILEVNSFVVPMMILFTLVIVGMTVLSPGAGQWMKLSSDAPLWRVFLSPFIYTAFNLALAQAVLVPIGAEMKDRRAIELGGMLGGIGIGFMLLSGHIALSAQMPGVEQYEIPMGMLVHPLGKWLQLSYVLLIFCEIFTTFIANVYGLTRQLGSRLRMDPPLLTLLVLIGCFAVSQLGFSMLLGTLYPLFGVVSMGWLAMLIARKQPA